MTSTPVHTPVLLFEVLDNLVLPPAARILDLTLGMGGHAEAILARCDPDSRYLGVDRDPEARQAAKQRLGSDARLNILASSYEDVWTNHTFEAWQALQAPDGLDAILMDLGVSTLQLKSPARGFSFRDEGPLDMRMDTENGPTALQWIAEQSDTTLADAIYQFGEERASRPIARAILKVFNEGRLHTTADLAEAVHSVLPMTAALKRQHRSDTATRTFQAIRIAVNGELVRLAESIERAIQQLRPGGRLAVISFHSLEDRIVKQTLRRLSGIYDGPGRESPTVLPKVVRLIHAGGITPSSAESQANPPSRSARLEFLPRFS
ncbi:MAG: 16S rRNA (cytosine(1402)-N(4))-methyltransferase RsmH [Holophagaceae bacterium]|nr:16S rRNA (cytosine(1402)-N(4))-methyltransferase RsmH [Holophagaceae bacterium]